MTPATKPGRKLRAARLSASLGAAAALLGPIVLAPPVSAQAAGQPARGSEAARLSAALRTLAGSPNSVPALIAAGEASLKLDNAQGALGYFRRAEALVPQDGRVKAGLAAVMVRQHQPAEALRLFAEAERAGALTVDYVADRGLAYDLAGDNARAQADYALALSAGPDAAITRRLALSQAIAGDLRASETTLLPLLQRSDLAAYRTRAFALAIGGKADEAVSIAQTMLPEQLAGRLGPYLRYMPRLTRAQQAAAANLGSFPPAAEIGRDDPALAALSGQGGRAAPAPSADSRLVPSGAPLGGPPARPPAAVRAAPPAQVAAAPRPVAAPTPALARAPATSPAPAPRAVPAPLPAPPQVAAAPAAMPPAPAEAQSSLAQIAQAQGVGSPAPVAVTNVAPPPVAVANVAPVAVSPQGSAPPPPAAAAPAQPVVVAALPAPRPSLSIAEPAPQPATPAPRAAVALSDAFAEFRAAGAAPAAVGPAAGAVDITAIQPRREQPVARPMPAPTPAPRPAPPPVSSRHWVQVATGRDVAALAFDWRRIRRQAAGLLDTASAHTARWGESNRLVAGPFPTQAAADQLIARLKEKQVDAFRFTSATGEEVRPLS